MVKTKILFPIAADLRKGERTRIKLIESAFVCIARDGYYRTTFQTIADEARISQPLAVRIIGTRENIFPLVAEALLKRATELTIERLQGHAAGTLGKKIEAYYEVSFEMLLYNPLLSKFYMNLYYLSTYDSHVLVINRAVRRQAIERLEAMLTPDLSAAVKKRIKSAELAELLHNNLTGYILNTVSLNAPWDVENLKRGLNQVILKGLGL